MLNRLRIYGCLSSLATPFQMESGVWSWLLNSPCYLSLAPIAETAVVANLFASLVSGIRLQKDTL